MSSRTGNAFRGFVRDRAQDAQEVADASEAGRTPAENERKALPVRERLNADTSWIVTKKSAFFGRTDFSLNPKQVSSRMVLSTIDLKTGRLFPRVVTQFPSISYNY